MQPTKISLNKLNKALLTFLLNKITSLCIIKMSKYGYAIDRAVIHQIKQESLQIIKNFKSCKLVLSLFIILLLKMRKNSFTYSPFNKTYQYLCLQQQLSHRNNLKQVKSTNCSNIKTNKNMRNKSHFSLRSSSCNINDPEQDYQFLKPYMVIHKNERFDSRQNTKRILDNRSLVSRLMNASCSVITRDQSLDSYRKHQKYYDISSRYDKNGKRKQLLKLNQSSLQFSRISNSIKQHGRNHKNYYCTLNQKNIWR